MTKGSWVQDIDQHSATKFALELTDRFHRKRPRFYNKLAQYIVGKSKSGEKGRSGIYFVDKIQNSGDNAQ